MKKLSVILVIIVIILGICPMANAADGYVDLSIYIYDNGSLASGYRAQIDETVLVSDDEGKVTFKELTVESHSITFTNKDGKTSVGNLNLVAGNSTTLLGASMGGNFEVEISNATNNAYMEVTFISEFHFDLTSVSESKPNLPQKPQTPEKTTPPTNADKDEEKEGGISLSPTLLLIIILICVIVIVALIIMLKKKSPAPYASADDNTVAKTGGKNKFEDKSKL